MKYFFLTIFAVLILVAMIGPMAQAIGSTTCYTTWDDTYIFVAVKVDSSNVRGTHSDPNASVSGDDTVTLYINTDGNTADKINQNSFAFSVSAAAGCQFLVGSADGKLTPKQSFNFKYGVQVQGTINSGTDTDSGWTVEIALPWKLLGVSKAVPGSKLGFNIVTRDTDGKELSSMSPMVKVEDDVLSPAKWSAIELSGNNPTSYTPDRSRLVCTKYATKPPLIDGDLKATEWVERYATTFSSAIVAVKPTVEPVVPAVEPKTEPVKPATVVSPEPVKPVVEAPIQPAAASPSVEPKPEPVVTVRLSVPKLVFTHYFYWFQADQDRGIPVENVWSTDGKYLMQDLPPFGLGPWFTYDRVQWHLEQLQQITDAGIDVILPVYRGDKADKAGYARKGLDCLVSALNLLAKDEKRVPSVGLFLDTYGIRAAYGRRPNLKDEEVRSTLYGMIKDFFDRIPVQYRALVQTRKNGAEGIGNVVFLGSARQFVDVDSSVIDYCNKRFRQDFGANLVWVVDSDCTDNINGYDGVASLGAGLGCETTDGPNVRIASVGSGYDNSAVALPGQDRIRSRMDTKTYSADWDTAFKFQPDWVVCDGWNNFNKATEIAQSIQYGSGAVSVTKDAVSRFKGTKDYDAAYDWLSLPTLIQSKQFNVARITLRNAGAKAWLESDKVSIAYRWYKDGKYFADSGIKIPLRKAVQPGESITTDFGIAPVDEAKSALPAGDAVLRLELVRASDNKWFSDLGDDALMLPVVIGNAPDLDMSVVKDGLPVLIGTGTNYKTQLTLRNEGTRDWPAASSKLIGRLYRVSNYTHDNSSPVSELVDALDINAKLPYDCTSGMVVDFDLDIKLTGKDGSPLPAWDQSNPWSYRLVFDVVADGSSVSAATGRSYSVPVSIFADDLGVWIADSQVPAKFTVGQKAKVKIAVRNASARTWKPGECAAIAKWYTADGLAFPGPEYKLPLKNEIGPDKFDMLTGEIQAPERDGMYILMWDMLINGKIASKSPIRGKNDIGLQYVQVTGGSQTYVDLGSLMNCSAFSYDTDRKAANFDANGASYPAELLPPFDELSGAYPVGYGWTKNTDVAKRVNYVLGNKKSGSKNAVICDGQKISLPGAVCTTVNLLIASDVDTQTEFSLEYDNSSTPVKVSVPGWKTGGADVAFGARHIHNADGDVVNIPCYIYSLKLPVDTARKLTGIVLPKTAGVKLFAVTLEK